VAGAVLLAGCSTPGQVKDFNEDTQSNFIDACKIANDQGLNEADVTELCGCWYDAVTTDDGGMSFEQFKREDENIREAIDAGRFNNEGDFQREAPTLYAIVTNNENCALASGPTAG
jgi:hypothetical protein